MIFFYNSLNAFIKKTLHPLCWEFCSFTFNFYLSNTVRCFQPSISCVNLWMYVVSAPNVLGSFCTYIFIIIVIIYILLINWIRTWFVFCYITFFLTLFKRSKTYNISSLFMGWCSVRNIRYFWSRCECLWIRTWHVC